MFDWIKRKTSAPPVPSQPEPDRYAGRPLLIILEKYVLSAIGHLTAEQEATAEKVVQHVWKGSSDWKQTVRAQLHLEDGLDQQLREMWTRNLDIARKNGVTLHSDQFAMMVVDQNFAKMFERVTNS